MSLLQNKVAIVTGASSGIGWEAAKLFAKEGASLIVGARREKRLKILVEEISSDCRHVEMLAGDVRSEEYNAALVDLAISKFGRLDVAFNNAGTLGKYAPLPKMSLKDWNEILETNLTSGYLAAKYQVPAMLKRGGSIIFTSSFVGYTVGLPDQAAYAASKAGLIGLTKSLASEYGEHGIRINALLPGGTKTEMAKEFTDTLEGRQFIEEIHALKRMASAEEIARAALFLASEMSSFITGTAMLADGGVSICRT